MYWYSYVTWWDLIITILNYYNPAFIPKSSKVVDEKVKASYRIVQAIATLRSGNTLPPPCSLVRFIFFGKYVSFMKRNKKS